MTVTVPARWQHQGRQGKTPRLIVLHCTVSKEMGNGAEAVARYFQTSDRPGSTHKVCDNNSTVRCVADADTAYGAAGANNDGLHLELVGMPDQTTAQWLDPFSDAELHEAGPSIREWSTIFSIPLRWLTIAEVADGRTRGMCTHADVSKAFPKVSTGHWDPGPDFPKDEALRIWSGAPVIPPVTPPPASEEDTMENVTIFKDSAGGFYYFDSRGPVFFAVAKVEEAQDFITRGAHLLWAENATINNAAASAGVQLGLS